MSYSNYLNIDMTLFVPQKDMSFRQEAIPEEMESVLNEMMEDSGFDGSVRDGFYGERNYDYYEEDLKNISREFPNVLISVNREGEDHDDLEHQYFLGGGKQSCYAEITFPEFDPSEIVGGEVPVYQPDVEISTDDYL